MGSMCHGIISSGVDSMIIDIECYASNNLPTIIIVGFAHKTVLEAKDRIRGAFASSKLALPRRRITINLAPADIPKSDSSLDLAIAAAVLSISQTIARPRLDQALIGELGLDGSVRPVRGIIGKLQTGRDRGLHEFFIPSANLTQARLVPNITLFPVNNLSELYEHLSGTCTITPVVSGNSVDITYTDTVTTPVMTLDNVVGQSAAKRAVCIAAAGGHNLFLSGPPGTGKSMLAKTLPTLLPPLTYEEMLEVTHLQSLINPIYDRLATRRPVRSPHHTTSHTALIGGNGQRPGEISLSHRGVLILDEFPEFGRQTLESLRQPLEDHTIRVSRAKMVMDFPAHFILVATANPCPCGYYGSDNTACTCSVAQLQRYRTKLSGPIFDRIDLCSSLEKVDYQRLLTFRTSTQENAEEIIANARTVQAARYKCSRTLNSDLSNAELQRYARLTSKARSTLNQAALHMRLSARAYMRTVKVARTIADMEGSAAIQQEHVSEALYYRQPRPAA